MKISQQQLFKLYQIAMATLPIANDLAFSQEERLELMNEILNQQDDTIIDLKEN